MNPLISYALLRKYLSISTLFVAEVKITGNYEDPARADLPRNGLKFTYICI